MIEWFFIALVCMVALTLARKLVQVDEELRIERRLREQAEQREEEANEARRRVAALNWRLAKHTPTRGGYHVN